MSKLKNFWEKLKSIKNVEVYVAIVLAVVAVAIVFLGGSSKNTEKTVTDDSYISQMEHKICSVVEKIDGCGKAEVAISFCSNEEVVYAYETEVSTSGGVTTEKRSIVFVKGEPLVVTTLPPKILGVVVVAEGAANPIVKFKRVEVVVTLLGVSDIDVQVFTYKS